MAIPSAILSLAENHSCFSGCYASGHDFLCLVNPNLTPEPGLDVQCEDCLTFRIGGLVSQLGPGMTRDRLARELSAHVAAHRGYAFSFGGYHTQGGGFWLSAAYWDSIGVFLLKSDRGISKGGSSDVDLLTIAFGTGVAKAPDPGMLDPREYVSHRVFLKITAVPPLVDVQTLLASSCISRTSRPGYVELTLAEYLPVSRAVSASGRPQPSARVSAPAPARPATPRRPPQLGELCPVCGEVVSERPLLTSLYVGCGCS